MIETINKGMLFYENGRLIDFSKNREEYTQKYIKKAEITINHRKIFDEYREFLGNATEEQKLGIIHDAKNIVCIAGAGCGKTKVLTERAKYLVNSKQTYPKDILAITFTRKTKQDMEKKLKKYSKIKVETFNSFCEEILSKYNDKIYTKKTEMINDTTKQKIIKVILKKLNTNIEQACNEYFEEWQKRIKTKETLEKQFIDDCFIIRDHFKNKNQEITPHLFDAIEDKHKKIAKLFHDICIYINKIMEKCGLRDYADQITDTIKLFEKHPETIPKYEHILIDEYQDVNSQQIKLLKLLNSSNTFAVGDPRQAIYGWRGSDINYLLNFEKDFHDAEEIDLTKNHRSTKNIVELANKCIEKMKLNNLTSEKESKDELHLHRFDTEEEEYKHIIDKIFETKTPRNEIFILARKRNNFQKISQLLTTNNIKHIIIDNKTKNKEPKEDEIILSTIHSIKGLEADLVFVINASNNNFPNRVSEHPILEMIKIDNYNKEAEEKRLFYVAISRARKNLHISYSKDRPTNFITYDMKDMMIKHGFY